MRRLLAAFALIVSTAPSLADMPDAVDLRVMVRTEAVQRGLPAQIADAVAAVESGYRIDAIGDVGEIGLMQVRPSTARMLGFAGTDAELSDPRTNIRYGVEYLLGAWKLAGEDLCTTVMKYRAGHGETRFSAKSVAYCVRVRQIIAAQGYPVRGEVPKVDFGEPAPVMTAALKKGGGAKTAARAKSRINWAAYDRRIKAIESRVTEASLTIMR